MNVEKKKKTLIHKIKYDYWMLVGVFSLSNWTDTSCYLEYSQSIAIFTSLSICDFDHDFPESLETYFWDSIKIP